jgi:hypothetical protein
MAQEPTVTRVALQVLEEMLAHALRVAVRHLHELHSDTHGGARSRGGFRRPPPGDAAARVHLDLVPGQGKPDLDLLAGFERLRAFDEDAAETQVDDEQVLPDVAQRDGTALNERDADLPESGLVRNPFRRRGHLLHREGPRSCELAPRPQAVSTRTRRQGHR